MSRLAKALIAGVLAVVAWKLLTRNRGADVEYREQRELGEFESGE